ncbi:MAG: hypothetical protein EHM79_04480 [Geobacter sp.]|nr:MAG: hypothetical protein EHM79_04480 [Geobacter sp.]
MIFLRLENAAAENMHCSTTSREKKVSTRSSHYGRIVRRKKCSSVHTIMTADVEKDDFLPAFPQLRHQ